MNTEATAWLTFCVQVKPEFRHLLEEEGAIRKYNEKTGASLGFLEAGFFEEEELYVTTYCERAATLEPSRIEPADLSDEQTAVWRGQLQRFLREYNIPQMSPAALRLIADLDD